MERTVILILVCLISKITFAQNLDNATRLLNYKVFGFIEMGVPEGFTPSGKNKKKMEELGFAKFENPDKRIRIEFRRLGEADLSLMKKMTDGLSIPGLQWKVLKNDIKEINGLSLLVTEAEGQTTKEDQVGGIFIYTFNAKGNSYRLWMHYPLDAVGKTEELRDRMLHAVRILE